MSRTFIVKALLLAGIAAVAAGCSGGPEKSYRTITVSGDVNMVAGPMPEGKIHFRLYNLWYLDGPLRHALEEIEDFTSDTPQFSHTFEYPLHKGTGLAIHAWVDTDGDDLFCTPTVRNDPAGLATMEETPEGDVTLNVVLEDNCRAANYFYPPKKN